MQKVFFFYDDDDFNFCCLVVYKIYLLFFVILPGTSGQQKEEEAGPQPQMEEEVGPQAGPHRPQAYQVQATKAVSDPCLAAVVAFVTTTMAIMYRNNLRTEAEE